jgi:hypothetical protein
MKTLVAQGFPAFVASRPGTPFPAFSRRLCQKFARKFDRPDLRVSGFIDREIARGWIPRPFHFPLRITITISASRSRFGNARFRAGGSDGR